MDFLDRGHSQQEAAHVFGLHKETVNIWRQQYVTTGSLEKKSYLRKFRKIDPEKLKAYMAEHSDAYLQEIGDAFGCSDMAIFKALKRLGLTRKKRPNATRSKTLQK